MSHGVREIRGRACGSGGCQSAREQTEQYRDAYAFAHARFAGVSGQAKLCRIRRSYASMHAVHHTILLILQMTTKSAATRNAAFNLGSTQNFGAKAE
jgi:hypothetical protein